MRQAVPGIVSYLTRVDVAETGRPARSWYKADMREDNAGFACWLDLLVTVCPGPLSEILAPAALARQHLSSGRNPSRCT